MNGIALPPNLLASRLRLAIGSIWIFFSATFASAERAPEDRKQATHVLIGKVTEIKRGGDRKITVSLKVTGGQRGENVGSGEVVPVLIFGPPDTKTVDPVSEEFKKLPEEEQNRAMAKALESFVTFSGHRGPPPVGQEVRVYLRVERSPNDGERWVGIYPDWFDRLDEAKE